ncbi:hypothetical protein ACP4OV_011424 [Aristida adscensionis]
MRGKNGCVEGNCERVETEPRQPLPDDLVLEIVVRCAAIATIIRCAATGKPIRRGILNAPFLRRLRRLLDRNDGHDARHFFLPPLLLGLYHQAEDPRRPPAFARAAGGAANYPASVAALPPAPDLGAADGSAACDFGTYKPVASRGSLLVLRRRCKTGARQDDHLVERHGLHPVELSVCNPMTGERRVLPPNDVCDVSHALLDVDPLAPSSSSSFKLLVADLSCSSPRTLFVQVFSSEQGEWGPAMASPVRRSCEFLLGAGSPRPLVLGGAVHWLCSTRQGNRVITWPWRGEPAPHEAVSLARLPGPCESSTAEEMCLAMQPSAAGSSRRALLSVIVASQGSIQVWVREESGNGGDRRFLWTRRRRIEEANVARPMDVGDRWLRGAEVSCFCEGSGAVLLRRPGDGAMSMSPLLLDLDGMAASKLQTTDRELELHPEPGFWFCPYEVDLLSYMLFAMRSL